MPWTEPPRDWTDTELVTESIMDTHIRDQFKATPHLLAEKTADETVTSSTVLQDDDHLVLAVAANELWYIQAVISFADASAGVGHLKVAFTFPASTTSSLSGMWFTTGGAAFIADFPTSGASEDLFGATVRRTVVFSGLVAVAGTAGNLRFQFAQVTSNASGVTVHRGSAFYGRKIA